MTDVNETQDGTLMEDADKKSALNSVVQGIKIPEPVVNVDLSEISKGFETLAVLSYICPTTVEILNWLKRINVHIRDTSSTRSTGDVSL